MSEDNQHLPPELEWTEMEEGILTKMNELEASAKFEKRSALKRLMTGLSIAVLLLFIPTLCTLIDQEIALTAPDEAQTKSILEESDEQSTRNLSSTPTEVSTVVVAPEQLIVPSMTAGPTTPLEQEVAEAVNNSNGWLGVDKIISDEDEQVARWKLLPITVNRVGGTLSDPILVDLKLGVNKPMSVITSNETNETKELAVNELRGQQAQVLAYGPVFLTQKPIVANLPAIEYSGTTSMSSPPATPEATARVTLLGGVSFWNMGYNTTKPEREAYEEPLTSFFSQLSYTQAWRRNYSFLVGFQYQELENRFAWNTPVEDYTITLIDTIVRIERNSITGEETIIRGDVELVVPAERVVQHYNKTALYQAQLALGKTWTAKKWQLDAMVGAAFSVSAQNEGRTLYQTEVLDYNGAENELFKNQWKAHAMVSGRLTYRLTERWGLTTNIQLQHSVMDWSTEQQSAMRPSILNIGMGVNYSL